MKPITIGTAADGRPLVLTPELRKSTHMHVIGGSGTGKSKFLEWLIRNDVRKGNGFCVIDWHGTLYQDVLKYCAKLRVGTPDHWRKLVLINPSRPDYITGYNPFMYQGEDVSVQVQRRIDATIRPWGITDTNAMPTFERICRVLYTFAVEQRVPLVTVQQLLRFNNSELREYAARILRDPRAKAALEDLQFARTARDWREETLSTENRIGRFLSSTAVRRFMGLASGNIDLMDVMDNQTILLVNLGSSGYLDREAARVFASLFLYDFFDTAMRRAQLAMERGTAKPKTFVLYLDEFQEYITEDIAAMLDEVRKGGLHMVLAHQHLGHLADNPRLKKSVFTNARLRAVFGGLDYEDSSIIANEMFLPDLNARQIKKAYYHTIHLYSEQTRTSHSKSSSISTTSGSSITTGVGTASGFTSSSSDGFSMGTGMGMPDGMGGVEGWFSQSESTSRASTDGYSDVSSEFEAAGESRSEGKAQAEGETVVPVWVPIPVQELGSESEWSREEKVSKVAEILKTQPQRHCFIKLDTEKTQPLMVPFVQEYRISQDNLLDYQYEVYQTQAALTAAQVDHLIAENETKFLSQAQAYVDAEIVTEGAATEGEAPAVPPPVAKRRSKPKPKAKATIYDNVDLDSEDTNQPEGE